ncbi:MAG: CCA tRNA nucleotidyltransferase [Kiritimatiellia bacterium]
MRVARRVQTAGGRAFFVGGCVRDAAMGRIPNDIDVEVYGLSPGKLEALLAPAFRLDKVGVSFGVIKLVGVPVDVSLPRRESKFAPGHRGVLVDAEPALPFHDACARRDFTINAILLDPLAVEIIDPFNGLADIQAGILRHVGPRFVDDSLRVLRAMQFAARLDFTVAPETLALCRTMSQDDLPRERLAGEWEKLLLLGRKPSLGLAFLRDCGWIRHYPELEALIGCEQDPRWHPEGDVWTHTLHAVDALPHVRTGGRADDLLVAVSVLCHDFGKPETTQQEPDGRIISHGHEKIGERQIRSFIDRLWNLGGFADAVVRLVACHMRPMALVLADASDKAYRRLAVEARRMDLLALVMECDLRATPPHPVSFDAIKTFRRRTREAAVDREPPKPLVLGRHLIERGFDPGPSFKTILDACYERQIDGEFNDHAGAMEFLDAFLADASWQRSQDNA